MSLQFEKSKQTKMFMGECQPVFYFDRISVKEGVDFESHKDYDKFIEVTLVVVVIISSTTKVTLTTKNELVIDVTKCY